MKNRIIFTLVCAMIAGVLAGCDQKPSDDSNATQETNGTSIATTFNNLFRDIKNSTIEFIGDDNASCDSCECEDGSSDEDRVLP